MSDDFIIGLFLAIGMEVLYLVINEKPKFIDYLRCAFSLPYATMGFSASFFFAVRSSLSLKDTSLPILTGVFITFLLAFLCKVLNDLLDSSAEKGVLYYILLFGIFLSSFGISLYTLTYLYKVTVIPPPIYQKEEF